MFYTYNQNNSGGDFITDDKVCHYVIIEADNHRLANVIAEDLGIYFDGCNMDMDCPCCGDRWYEVDERDGKPEPMIYHLTPETIYEDRWGLTLDPVGEVYCRVYYKNGEVKEYNRPDLKTAAVKEEYKDKINTTIWN